MAAPTTQTGELRARLAQWLERYYQPRPRAKIIVDCERLQFPPMDDDPTLSKSRYLQARLRITPEADLARLAEAILVESGGSSVAEDRFGLEEELWARTCTISVNKKVRREIAHALGDSPLFHKSEPFLQLLKRLWPQRLHVDDFLAETDSVLLKAIIRHTIRNPGDWDAEQLFEQLGVFEVSHRRFCLLLEGLASAEVRPDEAAQRQFVVIINRPLAAAGAELREVSIEDGYPVFRVVPQ